MTTPPERVEIRCSCGMVFPAWRRRSINLSLGDDWTPDEIDEMTHATCPSCGAEVDLDTLIVDGDTWTVGRS